MKTLVLTGVFLLSFFIRAKPAKFWRLRTRIRRQLRQTGERHSSSGWLRRLCLCEPAIPALLPSLSSTPLASPILVVSFAAEDCDSQCEARAEEMPPTFRREFLVLAENWRKLASKAAEAEAKDLPKKADKA